MTEPKPGDFFVVATNGLLAKIVRFGTSSTVNHAGIYVGEGKVIEARPGGAGYNTVETYKNALWSTDVVPARFTPTVDQRKEIVMGAEETIGTKYGMLDIACIAFAQRRLGSRIDAKKALDKQPWWLRKIQNRKTLICSQLVDQVYTDAGIHFYNDGRPEGLVSPEDIREIIALGPNG